MPHAYGTCIESGIVPRHEIGTSDAYRGELFGILLGLTALQAICPRHNIKKQSATIGFVRASSLRSAQYCNISHPIDKANAELRKVIVAMR